MAVQAIVGATALTGMRELMNATFLSGTMVASSLASNAMHLHP